MKKVIRVNNLDCAVCAKKLEDAIKKIEGISFAEVSFLGQKMTVIYDDDKQDVLSKIKTTAKKLEPDWELMGI